MKKSTGGLQYVKDFSFPADQGFTGSAGRSEVKGYMRGGSVKGGKRNKPCTKRKLAKGTTNAAMGGFMGPEREIAVDDVTITVPKMKGGAVHQKLKAHGKQMGYKYGGQVKDTSGEFKAKRGKQDPMDHGVQPARRGKNARNAQEAEAGGTGRLTPGLKKGGKVKKSKMKGVASSGGGALADAALRRARAVLKPSKDMKKPERAGTAASRKGMPKNVKAKGGKVNLHPSAARRAVGTTRSATGGAVHKARGGSVKK